MINNYEIKNLKFFRGHDGKGFNLTLYHKNKRIAYVDNDGWGGGFNYKWFDRPYEVSFYTMLKLQPKWEYNGKVLDMSADIFIDKLKYLVEETNWVKKNFCFQKKDQKNKEEWHLIKFKTIIGVSSYKVLKNYAIKEYGNEIIILNEREDLKHLIK